MKKLLAIALLSVAITACESNPTDDSNAAKPTNATPAATAAPATPTPETSPPAKIELKAGDKVKVTVNGIDPVIGDSTSDARSYKKRDDRTSEFNTMNHGRVVGSGRIVVSADGKSRTVVTSGTDRDGKPFKNVAVYDKQ